MVTLGGAVVGLWVAGGQGRAVFSGRTLAGPANAEVSCRQRIAVGAVAALAAGLIGVSRHAGAVATAKAAAAGSAVRSAAQVRAGAPCAGGRASFAECAGGAVEAAGRVGRPLLAGSAAAAAAGAAGVRVVAAGGFADVGGGVAGGIGAAILDGIAAAMMVDTAAAWRAVDAVGAAVAIVAAGAVLVSREARRALVRGAAAAAVAAAPESAAGIRANPFLRIACHSGWAVRGRGAAAGAAHAAMPGGVGAAIEAGSRGAAGGSVYAWKADPSDTAAAGFAGLIEAAWSAAAVVEAARAPGAISVGVAAAYAAVGRGEAERAKWLVGAARAGIAARPAGARHGAGYADIGRTAAAGALVLIIAAGAAPLAVEITGLPRRTIGRAQTAAACELAETEIPGHALYAIHAGAAAATGGWLLTVYTEAVRAAGHGRELADTGRRLAGALVVAGHDDAAAIAAMSLIAILVGHTILVALAAACLVDAGAAILLA